MIKQTAPKLKSTNDLEASKQSKAVSTNISIRILKPFRKHSFKG